MKALRSHIENMTFSVKPGRASSDTTKIKGFMERIVR